MQDAQTISNMKRFSYKLSKAFYNFKKSSVLNIRTKNISSPSLGNHNTTIRHIHHKNQYIKSSYIKNQAYIKKSEVMEDDRKGDVNTQSNYKDIRIIHSDYTFSVDFNNKEIEGYVKLDVKILKDNTKKLILDTNNLEIYNTYLIEEGKVKITPFKLGESQNNLGKALIIDTQSELKAGTVITTSIRFVVTDESEAIQWLDSEKTLGKKHPYMYTQSGPSSARTILPCQDTPSVKMTYTAAIRVPQPLTALMSAISIPAPEIEQNFEMLPPLPMPSTIYYFSQDVPIPSYLIALVVGELESKDIGPISKVWSEPSILEAAADEFSETSKFLDIAIDLCGSYVWKRYDILVLPPSYSYGGMENPCLTYVTPALISGDKSLVDTIMHEIIHSWIGNLVTLANFEHLWLIEGFTMLLERKILGRVRGEDSAQLSAINGYLTLKRDVINLDPIYTSLVYDLSGGQNPESYITTIIYEKGFYFLYYLEQLLGGPSQFEPFFRAFIEKFKYQSIITDDFKCFLMEYFKENPKISEIDWDTWLYGQGMPPVENTYNDTLVKITYQLAEKWHQFNLNNENDIFSNEDIKEWTSEQILVFIDKLIEYSQSNPLDKSITRKMNDLYNFDNHKNSEIRTSWCQLCIMAEDDSIMNQVIEFLSELGRMKYLKRLYKALSESQMGKDIYLETLEKNKNFYHPVAYELVKNYLCQNN